jgi:putative hydrolase of the HAD superfamily
MKHITHLVFDLGGVIVELKGKPIKPEWFASGAEPDDIWHKWLLSEAPREYESGRISELEFGRRIVDELALKTTSEEFLNYFAGLPVGPYAGARELLLYLKQSYMTALFSNSNVVHWARKMGEMQLGELFDFQFASHLMGCAKPEPLAYHKVLEGLGVPAKHILFFDDNKINVDAALQLNINAVQVDGFEHLVGVLDSYGIADTQFLQRIRRHAT